MPVAFNGQSMNATHGGTLGSGCSSGSCGLPGTTGGPAVDAYGVLQGLQGLFQNVPGGQQGFNALQNLFGMLGGGGGGVPAPAWGAQAAPTWGAQAAPQPPSWMPPPAVPSAPWQPGLPGPAAPQPGPTPPWGGGGGAGYSGGGQSFEISRALAQRDAQQLLADVQQALQQLQAPAAQAVRLDRWEDRRDHGFMGDKPNRTKQFNTTFNSADIYDMVRSIEVPPGVQLIGFSGENLTGSMRRFGPGVHHATVRSGVVLPDVNIDALVDRLVQGVASLATPQNGCLINASNYRNDPLVTALGQFLDAVAAKFGPAGQQYLSKKQQVLGDIANNVISNWQACQAAQSGGAPRPTPAPAPGPRPQQPMPLPGPEGQAACPSNTFFRGKCVPQNQVPCPTQFNASVDIRGIPVRDKITGQYKIWCMRPRVSEQIVTQIAPGHYMRQPKITPYGGVGRRPTRWIRRAR